MNDVHDKGTENSLLAASHMALGHSHDDNFSGENSFRHGSSTTNTVSLSTLVLTKDAYTRHYVSTADLPSPLLMRCNRGFPYSAGTFLM